MYEKGIEHKKKSIAEPLSIQTSDHGQSVSQSVLCERAACSRRGSGMSPFCRGWPAGITARGRLACTVTVNLAGTEVTLCHRPSSQLQVTL